MIEDYIFVCLEINFVTDFFFSRISLDSLVTVHHDHLSCYVPYTKFYAFIEYKRHWNFCFIFGDILFLSVFFFLFMRLSRDRCIETVVNSVYKCTLLSDLLKEWSIQQVDRLVPIITFFHHTDDVIHQICNWSQNN